MKYNAKNISQYFMQYTQYPYKEYAIFESADSRIYETYNIRKWNMEYQNILHLRYKDIQFFKSNIYFSTLMFSDDKIVDNAFVFSAPFYFNASLDLSY